MTTIKIYRNLPIIDQVKSAPLVRRIFPFGWQFTQGIANIYITAEMPFIGFKLKIGKRITK